MWPLENATMRRRHESLDAMDVTLKISATLPTLVLMPCGSGVVRDLAGSSASTSWSWCWEFGCEYHLAVQSSARLARAVPPVLCRGRAKRASHRKLILGGELRVVLIRQNIWFGSVAMAEGADFPCFPSTCYAYEFIQNANMTTLCTPLVNAIEM